ncbi:unnamed protein product [Echinostoma caproni]|uniref:Ig-like domain-containing protein n=1 Tax=Echinostoma caproni TaxID=27848 RepID=A0A183AF77_9TREM|nr:unnamed protein product [Echinostoma caproni]
MAKCIFPGVGNRSAVIDITRPCPPGEYQCQDGRCLSSNLFCNGRPDCPDGSDESQRYCGVDVVVTPGSIRTKPFEMFRFECNSSVPGTQPMVLFDGLPIQSDSRFVVIRPSTEQVVVMAPQGLPDHGGHIFRCVSVTGSSKEITVEMETECPPGQYQCDGGRCISPTSICDGRPDCPDGSDENPVYCALDLLIIPGYIYIQPREVFEFVCESRAGGSPPHVRFVDGRPVESDSRFTVSRPTSHRVVVRAEDGIDETDHDTRMICYTAEGLSREIVVRVQTRCPSGQRQCRDGRCLPEHYFCNGRPDCADGSDEDPAICGTIGGDVTVRPGAINVRLFESFQFECISPVPDVAPQVSFDGEPVERYAQFTVSRPSTDRVVVNTPYGLSEPGIHLFSCHIVNGTPKEVLVRVEDGCGPSEFRCRDGTCIPRSSVCDRRPDCPDGSDESRSECPDQVVQVTVRFTPSEIRVQPGRRVHLECRTDAPGSSPTVRFADGRPISEDSRFVITRPNTETVVIEVPYGFDASTRRVVLICESPTGDSKTSTIHVDQGCQVGQRRCPGGDCIFVGQFCDGIEHCPDGYDERPENCAICDPISVPCQPVNGQQPSVTHFQLHWLCDGDNDCGNGFDELNCRNDTRHLDPSCGSTHFQCTSSPYQHIPFSYWCDGTIDCRGGEDEQDCARPAIVESGHREPYKVRPGDTLVLECEASGVPPPMIIWRFNWGCLPDVARARIEVVPGRSDCRGSRSRLTITGFRAGDDGIYNCEALAYSHRAMSQDILVLLDD